MSVKVSGVWKNVDQPAVKVSGVWKNVTNGFVKVSGVWKEFYTAYTPPSLVITGTPIVGTGSSGTNITTNTATGVVSDGEPTYSYLWTYVSGDSFNIIGGSSNTATFQLLSAPAGDSIGTYRCTVTDGQSSTAFDDVVVTITAL